jgi:uncharacterized membrane protein YphA (DoxX/SURF4 family)
MKYLAQLARIVTGAIFIFSGAIKLNDPVGTQIKLEEYFDVFAQDFSFMAGFWHALVPFALYLSILLCALEVILGAALLLQYRIKLTAKLLLALCIFFAFLTFYSAYFNKVTDCGCFGETIKLKPWTSFWKDIFLLVLLLIVLAKQSIFTNLKTGWAMALITVLSIGGGIYAYRHLPFSDGLAYKVGDSIPANRKPSEPLKYKYIVTKDGKEYEFEQYPTDTTYKYKEMILLNENARPKITDYAVWNSQGDATEETFVGKKLFFIVGDIHKTNQDAMASFKALNESLKGSNVVVWILTSNAEADFVAFQQKHGISDVPYWFADTKVLKTIVRSNPGYWLLKDGIVKGKWHYNDTPTKDQVLSN